MVKNAHYLLVTLLLCNALAMEVSRSWRFTPRVITTTSPATPLPPAAACLQTLPLLLDKMVHETVAIVISVTAVLLFGGEALDRERLERRT